MAVVYDDYLLKRLTDNATIRGAQRYKKPEVSYAGILYSLSILYNKNINYEVEDLITIINNKYYNKALYFDIYFIFKQDKTYKDLFMEELR